MTEIRRSVCYELRVIGVKSTHPTCPPRWSILRPFSHVAYLSIHHRANVSEALATPVRKHALHPLLTKSFAEQDVTTSIFGGSRRVDY